MGVTYLNCSCLKSVSIHSFVRPLGGPKPLLSPNISFSWFRVVLPGLSLALLVISYILPFVLVGHPNWMPCIKAKDSMPPKPRLLGHRGAVALAPENTNMSFIATTSHGGFGLESDLQISKVCRIFPRTTDWDIQNEK